MDTTILVNLAYIGAAICFIFGIKMLGRPATARTGNRLSAIGMLVAVTVTLFDREIVSFPWIIAGLLIGVAIGAVAARRVQMTGMPELVALFNGFGGLASLLVASAEFGRQMGLEALSGPLALVVGLTVWIGGITFTGSLFAYGKLSGKLAGKAKVFAGQKRINAAVAGVVVALVLLLALFGQSAWGWPLLVLLVLAAFALGFLAVMPIGGGDMPVVIALLNSCSGLAASAAGFVIGNVVLVVAGCLVGASGFILTIIMCKAMNRSLWNVLFSGFGSTGSETQSGTEGGELKPISTEDAYYILENARSVIFVPGYGMAVAQAQHAVKELAQILEANGAETCFAIHPVAGRMPGHMNVLLAEADVDYDQLMEMETVNPGMEAVDVAIVIGANDVVNPAATNDPSSPIHGMPIIEVHRAKTVFCLKRGQGAGFSGIENALFGAPNTRMLYGDAKTTVAGLVSQFKDSGGS